MVGFAYGDGRMNNLQTVDCEANRWDRDIVITWSRFTFYHKTMPKAVYKDGLWDHILLMLRAYKLITHVSTQLESQHRIQVLAWPSLSPDLTLIEHVWDKMGCELHSRKWQFTSQQLYSLGACQEQSTTSVFSDC